MRRRRSSPQNPSRTVYSRKPFLFMSLRTLLHSRNSQLLSFQSLAHSLPKTPGGGGTPAGKYFKYYFRCRYIRKRGQGSILELATRHHPLATSANFFRDGFGLQEEQQVIFPAGLGIRSGHVEAAKGMRADHRAGALAVQIKIPDVEHFFGLADLFGVLRVHRSGQPK